MAELRIGLLETAADASAAAAAATAQVGQVSGRARVGYPLKRRSLWHRDYVSLAKWRETRKE